MKNRILQKLSEIEQEKNVKILFACESGSRAWGFESPNSDWDIRFVYVHNKDWYLNLWDKKDTVQFMTEDLLDGSGWDLRKALKLMSKSNASFLSWLYSPIVYIDHNFLGDIKTIAEANHNPIAIFYHYHSMSKTFTDIEDREHVNLKKLFYALRTTLSAKWVIEKNSIPPTEFEQLLVLLPPEKVTEIRELMLIKIKLNESETYQVSAQFLIFLNALIAENESKKVNLMPKKANLDAFNAFFIKKLEK